MAILVTGGAGFIGSNFISDWCQTTDMPVVNFDKLTYAGNTENLVHIKQNKNYEFVQGDITDKGAVDRVFMTARPSAIIHFAAETHVDRSIDGPAPFIQTNILGTFKLLESTLAYWQSLPDKHKKDFRFLHVSTDEVYGSLAPDDPTFTENSRYLPSSPYSASKASSDHLVRSYFTTYGLPTLITNCSNNYGPYQFPEKLIPLMIYNALHEKPLPIYGDGLQARDWIYVTDHCAGIRSVLAKGKPGDVYNIGGKNEWTNIDIVRKICQLLDKKHPRPSGGSYKELITHVTDRPGHDRRYAINSTKIEDELGWFPREKFETGLEKTIDWYVSHLEWTENVVSGACREWREKKFS